MGELNLLEVGLLTLIINENKEKHPYLPTDLKAVKVKERTYRGVGTFTYFEYPAPELLPKDTSISSQRNLIIKGLENPLSYELNLTNGKMDFLEIVTNGNEKWDGNSDGFILE